MNKQTTSSNPSSVKEQMTALLYVNVMQAAKDIDGFKEELSIFNRELMRANKKSSVLSLALSFALGALFSSIIYLVIK